MNDEIKEILDKLKSDDYYEKHYQQSVYYERDLKKLEDYITNLQQDNEKIGKLWREEEAHCILLQQENERLKEENNNKAMNDYAHAIDESWYRELYDDYKSRCEKASAELKDWEKLDLDNLLVAIRRTQNILQNGSEEDE